MSDNVNFPSDVVQAIQKSVEIETFSFEGVDYTSRTIYPIPDAPQVDTLQISTLRGLVNFMESFKADFEFSAIHIINPNVVELIGKPEGRERNRPTYIKVKNPDPASKFPLNCFHSAEDFIIGLQTGFVDVHDRAKILGIVGNMKDESVKNTADDGTTQVVTARQGISLAENVKVPNPVRLAPYRTFPEVEQPSSEYILRVRKGKELPEVGLFETANVAWQVAAIGNIVSFLHATVAVSDAKTTPIIA